jgi:hypothetical protein
MINNTRVEIGHVMQPARRRRRVPSSSAAQRASRGGPTHCRHAAAGAARGGDCAIARDERYTHIPPPGSEPTARAGVVRRPARAVRSRCDDDETSALFARHLSVLMVDPREAPPSKRQSERRPRLRAFAWANRSAVERAPAACAVRKAPHDPAAEQKRPTPRA